MEERTRDKAVHIVFNLLLRKNAASWEELSDHALRLGNDMHVQTGLTKETIEDSYSALLPMSLADQEKVMPTIRQYEEMEEDYRFRSRLGWGLSMGAKVAAAEAKTPWMSDMDHLAIAAQYSMILSHIQGALFDLNKLNQYNGKELIAQGDHEIANAVIDQKSNVIDGLETWISRIRNENWPIPDAAAIEAVIKGSFSELPDNLYEIIHICLATPDEPFSAAPRDNDFKKGLGD